MKDKSKYKVLKFHDGWKGLEIDERNPIRGDEINQDEALKYINSNEMMTFIVYDLDKFKFDLGINDIEIFK